ncbi:MAG TPA: GxxExxY protein [Sulfuriferula sp.]|nr:GxxExxY protein [Sulfuriferula sp.]
MNHGGHEEHGELRDCNEAIINAVLSAAIAVHRQLGPGLLESVYEHALMIELADAGIQACRQVEVAAYYRGHDLGLGFRADIIVADSLLLEIKSVEEFNPAHLAQVMTYLKLLGFKRGYLLNFKKRLLKDGIKRVSI